MEEIKRDPFVVPPTPEVLDDRSEEEKMKYLDLRSEDVKVV